jgi:DNA polymerase I-like protein with 3'-5' exonuclease and polymerase domains
VELLSLMDRHQNWDRFSEWRPDALMPLDGIDEIELDTETTGLKWWAGDRPIGISIRIPDGRSFYYPWGHAGGNLDESTVRRWAKRELRGKRITNLNTRFDIHMLHSWGIDLEAQGCAFSDVGHYAALLDDHRLHFSLESISQDYLGIGKSGQGLDKTRMATYHAAQVAGYARRDVELVGQLKQIMWLLLEKEDLHRVRALEDAVIPVVCEMERNGCLIDVELLDSWIKECEQTILRLQWNLHRDTGVQFGGTNAEWQKLFKSEGIAFTEFTEPSLTHPNGQPSFNDDYVKRIPNPRVQMARRIVKLKSLNSKYLKKYRASVGPDGILRYALHQLKAQKDPLDEHAAGTVTGRFSSTGLDEDEGVNIQQVMKVAKQRVGFGYDEEDASHDLEIFIIRQLHIPEKGAEFLSADAMQIEYRLFADKAKSPTILAKYRQDPKASFHRMIEAMIKPFNKDLTYRRVKDLNFMKIYGGGMAKLAWMMDFITKYQFQKLRKEYNNRVPRTHPLLAQAVAVDQVYQRELPEAEPLIKRAKKLAEERGYVRDILGRRMRFPKNQYGKADRSYKALNGVIQPSAATINKQKLVEVHAERKWTGFKLRFTVHDEMDGCAFQPETRPRIQEILDAQSFPQLEIPILWEVNTGKNWKECA